MKITHKISEYISRNAARRNAFWRVTSGKVMFMHDGIWYDEKDFDKILSLYQYERFNDKGENQDKTKIK